MALSGSDADVFDASSLFQTYIVRITESALEHIRATGIALPSAEDRDLALNTLDYALKLSTAWSQTRDLLTALAPKMEQAGLRRDWMLVLDEGIRSSQRQGDVATEAELRLQKGILQQLLSAYDDACEQYRLSEACFVALGDQRGLARVWNRRAFVMRRRKELEGAESYARSALEAFAEYDPERGYSLLVLGTIAYDRQCWDDAVSFFAQSLQLLKMGGNERFLAWVHTNLGLTLWRQGDLQEAEAHLIQAITLFETIGDPIHQAVARMNLGNIYIALARPQQALSCYLQAEPIFRRSGDVNRQAMIYNNIGKSYRTLGKSEDAISALQHSIELWRTLDNPTRLANALEGLGLAYLEQSCYRNAQGVFQEMIEHLPAIEDADKRDNFQQRADKGLRLSVRLVEEGLAAETKIDASVS
jgi:tetratricopeptide (TPR) repeat protein